MTELLITLLASVPLLAMAVPGPSGPPGPKGATPSTYLSRIRESCSRLIRIVREHLQGRSTAVHAEALAERDARIADLESEVDVAREALRSGDQTITDTVREVVRLLDGSPAPDPATAPLRDPVPPEPARVPDAEPVEEPPAPVITTEPGLDPPGPDPADYPGGPPGIPAVD